MKITRFQQKFDETFYVAWDRFNDLLRGCPHHGFSEVHQLDTFYNALNSNDQDSLNSAVLCNFLDTMLENIRISFLLSENAPTSSEVDPTLSDLRGILILEAI
ncbi:hypothetical protein Tco_1354717 [Tanacetum coccineum]